MKKAESIEQTKLILSHLIDKIEVGDSKITLYFKFPVPQNEEDTKLFIEPFEFSTSISRDALETLNCINKEALINPDMFKCRLETRSFRN